jgi:hypothetical protein
MIQPYIYAIKGNGMTYYGSSIQPLCERKSTHTTTYRHYKKTNKLDKCCKSYLILDSCEDWIIEKIEELPLETTNEELLLRENYYIENFDCVNKNLAIRTEEIQREYQRKWAEENRRAKGIPIREKVKTLDEKTYKAEWMANKRASMSEEEKQKHLERRRELYSEKEQTEDQKAVAKERAKKHREAIKEDPEKLAQMKEYKRLKAQEYRKNKKLNQKID